MNQHRVEQSVTKSRATRINTPPGADRAQLEAEAAKQELPAAIKGPGCLDQADVESHKKPRRRSIADRLHLPHRGDAHKDKEQQARKSISADGPLQIIKDPSCGRFITKPNPHWPEEDSWKRENVRSGKGDSDVVPPGGVGGISYYEPLDGTVIGYQHGFAKQGFY
ncbi:hypothetical protein KC340_g4215 [Hortaea werneckii]|nr:hypothetical protein KC342_g3044 [Hortaea werneckii]KAI7109284.1 hypothetical protein KC339_g894 [Hortaea werneckii]KAI7233841.1 hypothetical protein KC365_g6197 [Hortaea werneckii]KAI7330437.1 hypothetical protein KC340_g4215 [Hortaea werneckii]KAI7385052.1 hypothetical protein KC328_g10482 [Hortaea werneckii]